jgi:cytoplasmic iron level regulating protein YaaA (DUF328/UPF0246 family)
MITVISPAKTLDFDPIDTKRHTLPRLPQYTNRLVRELKKKKSKEIQELMHVSEQIAGLNVGRFKSFKKDYNLENSKTSIHAFKGDVYLGLDVDTLSENDIDYAQTHLRVLSGLYGVLRPLDLMQPYRLEMGTKLTIKTHNNLYQFWGDEIVKLINSDLKEQGDDVLLNLASKEYFKSIDRKKLKAKIVNVDFLDLKNDKYKVISFFAKKARGTMTRFILKNNINSIEPLLAFSEDGYYYDSKTSTDNHLIFKRN